MATAQPSLISDGLSAYPIRNVTAESDLPFPQRWSPEDARTGGSLQILPGNVEIPAVTCFCFGSCICWDRLPEKSSPSPPNLSPVPDLAVEVLSENNPADQIEFKLNRYFEAGVLLVWYIEPSTRSARAYASRTEVVRLPADGQRDGGNVLLGFSLSLADLFERADRQFHRGKKSQD